MNRWISLALLVAVLVVLGGCQGSSEVETPRYSLDVQVRLADDSANDVVCRVILEDTITGKVVLKPVVFTSWGEPATITQGNEAESFVMTVMPDKETQSVEYSAEYLQNGQVVFQSQARVSLVAEGDV